MMPESYGEGERLKIPLQNGLYTFITPPIPHYTKILFYEEEKENQYWRHIKFPTQSEWDEMSLDEKYKFRDEEIRRRTQGVWFFNYNPKLGISKPVYITGHYYFYLRYFKIPKAGYPKHRIFQREFLYFIDLVEKNTNCDGEAVGKTRRGGITGVYSAIDLNIATLNFEVDIALQNKSLDDAKKVNLYNITFALDNIPYLEINGEQALLPKASNITKTQIIFGVPRANITSGKGSIEAEKKRKSTVALNSRIIVLPTTQNKDDTYTLFRSRKDEISKYPQGNKVNLIHEVAVLSTKRDGAPYGKLSFFSSSFEEDSDNFLSWRDIYYQSDPRKLLPNGKTKSGLWKYFISAIYAMNDVVKEKEGRELFDIYGECDEVYAAKYIRENLYAPYQSDPRAFQAKKREYPIEEEDAFSLGNATSTFDPVRLNEALMNIEELDSKHELIIERCDLEWEFYNKKVFSKRNDDHGMFEFYFNIDKEFRNRYTTHQDGRMMPNNDTPFIITVDPTSYQDEAKYGKGSKNAMVGGSLPDGRLEGGGNMVHVIYHGRPANVQIFKDDVKKLIIFLGAYCYVERNKEWLSIDLVKEGYGRFLLVKDEKNNFRQWTPKDKVAGGWTNPQLIEAYIRSAEQYMTRPNLNPDGTTSRDNILTFRKKELITQLHRFDPNNTEKEDIAVAFCLWTLMLSAFKRVKQNIGDGSQAQFIRSFYQLA